jgi:hypothetical protein
VRGFLDHRSETHAVRVVVLPQHGGETSIAATSFNRPTGDAAVLNT